jgi:KaiC/GvpD/RAD55 family RecA-like ATPase
MHAALGRNRSGDKRMSTTRQAFGIEELDRDLAGGLLPGTLTVVAGATGVGKTQLGLQWANAGKDREGNRGVVCDLTSRGDSQNHAAYASRLFNWELNEYPLTITPDLDRVWDFARSIGDYFHPVDRAGRRVTREDLEAEEWHEWKTDLSRVLRCSVGFFYQHFTRGTRRVVFDGVEPADRFSESIQFELFEYIYHHVLRKDDEWAAREWLRERYRANAQLVLQHRYDHRQIGCLYLYTTPHVLLDDLMIQPITQGDIFANANTIILMGRIRRDGRFGRALSILKHRGSACGDEVLPYRITEHGLVFESSKPGKTVAGAG